MGPSKLYKFNKPLAASIGIIMNPNKYFKIIIAANMLLMLTLLLFLANNSRVHANELIQHELKTLLRSHKESISLGNFRSLVSSLNTNEDDYYFSSTKAEGGQHFKVGNAILASTGLCTSEKLFQYDIYYCKNQAVYSNLFILFILAMSFILIVFYFFYLRMNKSLQLAFSQFFRAAQIKTNEDLSLSESWNKVIGLADELKKSHDEKINSEKQKVHNQLMTKMAHDIRSPLTALNLACAKLVKNDSASEIILQATDRITKIASEILKNRTRTSMPKQEIISTTTIDISLADVCKEKTIIYPSVKFIRMDDPSATRGFLKNTNVQSDLDDLCRIASNLLDNSVQAFTTPSAQEMTVHVKASQTDKFFILEVVDNGSGIAIDKLRLLGKQEFTDKENGNGIALFYAQRTVESWGGHFEIESTLGQKTSVRISLPIYS